MSGLPLYQIDPALPTLVGGVLALFDGGGWMNTAKP